MAFWMCITGSDCLSVATFQIFAMRTTQFVHHSTEVVLLSSFPLLQLLLQGCYYRFAEKEERGQWEE